ncbi:MAG: hypothetical protein R3C12_24035 [Planctomycetaceae bacterium]
MHSLWPVEDHPLLVVVGLGFDDSQSDVASVAEQEVGELLLEPPWFPRWYDDPAVSEEEICSL